MPPNENQAPLDNLVQEVDDILQGRYYYTVSCYASCPGWKILRWKTLRNCMLAALFITILAEIIAMNIEANRMENCVGDECSLNPVQGIDSVYNLVKAMAHENQGWVEEAGFNVSWKDKAPKPLRHYKLKTRKDAALTMNTDQESQSGEKAPLQTEPSTTIPKISNRAYALQFLVRYMMVLVCTLMLQLISELADVARDFVLKHLIAIKRRNIIDNFLQVRRIVNEE